MPTVVGFKVDGYMYDVGGSGLGYSEWQAASLHWQAYNTQQPVFSITSLDGWL